MHSAEWTAADVGMDQCVRRAQAPDPRAVAALRLWRSGSRRALRSARNDLTLLVEDELQPFQREGGGTPKRGT